MELTNSAVYLTVYCVILLGFTEAASPVFSYPASDGSTQLPISEDTASGTSIENLGASDADGDTLTFSITAGNTYFSVAGTTLRTANTFDYESGTTSYSITISVSDGTNTVNAVMVVTITDANDNTPVFSPAVYSASIEEGSAAGVSVAAVVCTDADSGVNGACTIAIQSGDDATAKFTVSGNTIQTSSNAIDYEALSSSNYLYSLVVTGSDTPASGTAKTGTAYVYVTITGKNDNAPSITSTSPGSASIGEDSAVGTTVFTVQATDADDGVDGEIAYSLTAGNSEGKFAIEASTGKIYVVKALDRENTDSYSLTAKAEDGGTPSQSAVSVITVTITDVSDNAPSCTSTIITKTVLESAASGDAVATLACSDDDSGDTLGYSITSGNAAGCFAIAGTTGVITTACSLDYDAGTREFTLLVAVTDSTTTTTATVVVEVGAVNEATPAFATNPTQPIAEDTAVGTSIFQYAATDADASPHGISTYAIFSVTNSGSGKFSIDETSGKIYLSQELDFEDQATYKLTITASDGTNTGTGTVTITVTDVNDNTPSCSPSVDTQTVSETTSTGTAVTTLACSDADTGDTLSYSITSGNAESCFAIDSGTGAITTACSTLDYDAGTRYYALLVAVTDSSKTTTATVVVEIVAVNEATPAFASNPSYSRAENTVVGTSITQYVATDADAAPHNVVSYAIASVTNSGAGKFSIDSLNGKIYLSQELDFEGQPSYELTITATDGTNTGTGTVTIAVTDVNDNSPTCSPNVDTKTVLESAASGTAVTTLACSDGDAGDTLAYSFSSGNAAGCFAIAGTTGAITTACTLDYDAGTREFTLLVAVTDSTTTTTATVVVEVGAVNGATPAFTTNPTQPIAEDTAVGTSIFQYAATDADASPHGISTYAIFAVTNSGSGKFSIDETSGKIYLSQELDFENQATYKLTITASDGTNTGTGTVTISVTDVNDNTPSCSPSVDTQTVSETTSTGIAVTTLACSDDDTGDTLSYSITSGNADSCFAVNSGTGAITTACSTLDYDAGTRYYTLLVAVTDSSKTTTATVVVEIVAVNEATPAFASNPSYSRAENTAVGTSITQYVATDADAAPHNVESYAIASVTNSGAGKFSIDTSNGKIYLSQELDFESQQSYELTITATDGTNTGTGTVTIAVTDINDNSPTCSPNVDTKTVLESAASGTAVTTLACSDADTGDTLAYSITSGNSESCFAINSGTGAITTACSLDYDAGTRDYTLLVTVTDSSTTTTATVVIEIDAVNEATPTFASNPTTSIAEDTVVGTSITTYAAADNDASPHNIILYTIFSVNNGGTGKFSIDQTTGKIQLSQEMDYESQQSYKLTITANDGTNTGTGTVTISITDVNDNTPSCSPAAHILSVAENTAVNTKVISSLACTDSDTGNTLSYSMTQNPGNKFTTSLTGTVASLIVNAALDYETTTFYQLKVTVTDDGAPALSTTVDVDVTITNVNEASPVFTSSGTYAVSMSEDTAVGSTIVTVTATDTDSGDVISYAFVTSYTGFLLDTDSGNVLLTQSLDREAAPSHELKVAATDGTSTTTATVTITVNDVNETPVFVSSTYTPTFAENQASATSVVKVSANDQDSGSDGTVTYTIVDGDGKSYFTIDSSTGIIKSSAIIDYEVNSFFYLIVRAADGASPSLSATCLVEITISDENDNAPVFVPSKFAESLSEDSAIGTTVVTLTATDADSSSNNNNVFEYSSVSSVPFTVHVTNGEITTNAALDRESTASYIMEVLATDKGSPAKTSTSTITISLIDVNDNNPIISGTYDTTIDEDKAVNSVIFTITASDADINDNGRLTYSINSGNTGSDFKIESGTGIIQTVNSLDRERTPSYTLVVYVVDNGGTPRTASVTCTVTINDLNDNTPQWASSYTFTVDENVVTSSNVGTIVATDLDTGVNSALSYSNIGYWQGDSNPFSIDGATGVITTSGSLDRETADTYVIWFRVQDGGSPILSSDINVTITINDLNDNDPVFGSSLYTGTVVENSAVSTAILTVAATDADIGNNALLTYSIDSSTAEGVTGNTYLTIGSSTGIIEVKVNIDRETTSYFNITVVATDTGTSARSGTATVQITVTDENDNDPVLSPIFYNGEVPYSDSCSSTVMTLTATDADINENAQLSYYLVTSDINFLFSLSSSTGALTTAGTLTTSSKYVLYAHARDSGTPERTTATSATLRIDAYTPGDVMISFYMSISKSTYTAAESTFLSQLDTVYQASYSTAITRRWCISESSASSIIVYIYVLQDNVTNDVANIDSTKNYLSASAIHGFVAIDSAGTPSSKITGSSWTQFGITKVIIYEESTDDSTPWIETTTGILVVTFVCIFGVTLIAGVIVYTVHWYRKRQKTKDITNPSTARVEIEEEPPAYEREKRSLRTASTVKSIEKKPIITNTYTREPGGGTDTTTQWLSNNDYLIKNRDFDGRAVDQESGKMYEYNTKTNERQWMKSQKGRSVIDSEF